MIPNKDGRKVLLEEFSKRKLKFFGFILLSLVSSLFEIVGIGLVFPFIYILVSPGAINHFRLLKWLKTTLNLETTSSMTMFLVIMIALIIVIKSSYTILFKYFQMRLLSKLKTGLSARLMKMYLGLSYNCYIETGVSQILKNIAISSLIIDHYIVSILKIIISTAITVGLITLLCLILPLGALVASIIFVSLLGIIYKSSKRKLEKIGVEADEVYLKRQQIMVSSIGAICETKIFGKEKFFINQFREVERRYFTNQQMYNFLSALPPVIIEAGMLIGIMSLISIFLFKNEQAHALAILSILLAAMFRALPQLNTILTGLQLLNSSVIHVNTIASELIKNEDSHLSAILNIKEKLSFDKEIKFKDICYSYHNKTNFFSLKKINLVINPGEFIGVTGHSAAGKSTFINLLIGLLDPTYGEITIDGIALSDKKTKRKWTNNLGYVPQSIFIFEDSIANNIAYGISKEEIDIKRVIEVMRIVCLDDLITKGEDFLLESIGDNGAKLSGGQRQRIGIARALYKDPSVLILDESTANLDITLELKLIENILNLKNKKTLILITHRVSSLRNSNKIFYFSQGKLLAQGNHEDLVKNCKEFKALTSAQAPTQVMQKNTLEPVSN